MSEHIDPSDSIDMNNLAIAAAAGGAAAAAVAGGGGGGGGGGGEGVEVSSRDRLAAIAQGFDSFEAEMKIGTRQRREREEFKLSELRDGMKRLDSALLAEIKRRTEMNKSTQMVRKLYI